MEKKSFTLLELTSVILIIGILSFMTFFVVQKLLYGSKDSQRTSDLAKIDTALSSYRYGNATYPTPDNPISVSDSGNVLLWKQGTLWTGVVYLLETLKKEIPKDPEGNLYGYSVSADFKRYATKANLDNISSNYISRSFAGYGATKINSSFNGFIVAKNGSNYNLWNCPSLFMWSGTALSIGNGYINQNNKPLDNKVQIKMLNINNLYDPDTSNDITALDGIVSTFSDSINDRYIASNIVRNSIGGIPSFVGVGGGEVAKFMLPALGGGCIFGTGGFGSCLFN